MSKKSIYVNERVLRRYRRALKYDEMFFTDELHIINRNMKSLNNSSKLFISHQTPTSLFLRFLIFFPLLMIQRSSRYTCVPIGIFSEYYSKENIEITQIDTIDQRIAYQLSQNIVCRLFRQKSIFRLQECHLAICKGQ